MILRRIKPLYRIVCSLLFLLPMVAQGQTAPSSAPVRRTPSHVRQKEGVSWGKMLWKGGMTRWDDGHWYLQMPGGYGDLIVMNFVDGYSYGPHATIGYINDNRNRWELEETLRYASGREAWLAKGALRWYAPIERGTMIEVHGGRHTEDFDRDPVMDMSHSLMATGIFGWSHYKLLERTDVGIRTSFALCNDVTMTAAMSLEKRRKMHNHKSTNFLGIHAQDNAPRVADQEGRLLSYLGSAPDGSNMPGRINDKVALLSLELDYRPQTLRMLYDDMTCRLGSLSPQFVLKMDMGAGSPIGEGGSDFSYLSVDLRVKQYFAPNRRQDRLGYMVSAGKTFKHGEIGLADWHHFDASRFWWQGSDVITHLALLDNYELSTDQWWTEGHAEWESDRMLLTQWTRNPDLLKEYLQVHAVKVPDRRMHTELQYGVNLVNKLRLGMVIGWDDNHYRGMAFTMVLNLQQ